MAQKLTIKTTVVGTIEIAGEDTAVSITTESEVTNSNYIDAIKNGVTSSISQAIKLAVEATNMMAQKGGQDS